MKRRDVRLLSARVDHSIDPATRRQRPRHEQPVVVAVELSYLNGSPVELVALDDDEALTLAAQLLEAVTLRRRFEREHKAAQQ